MSVDSARRDFLGKVTLKQALRRTPHFRFRQKRKRRRRNNIIIMEKERRHIHDDDEEEICDQRKSRTARQALEEVRVIILHINIIRSPNAFPYLCISFSSRCLRTSKRRSRNDVRSRKAEICIEKSRAEKRAGITKGRKRKSGKMWTER